ncbi:MAG TPA: hypothetical protein VJ201_03565 [Candidatus Babeliales bacterium]|nr:hypothetical protein [Candidatus Babeliales bacterium]
MNKKIILLILLLSCKSAIKPANDGCWPWDDDCCRQNYKNMNTLPDFECDGAHGCILSYNKNNKVECVGALSQNTAKKIKIQ